MTDEDMTRASRPGETADAPVPQASADASVAQAGESGPEGQGEPQRRGGFLAGVGEFVIAFAIMALAIWLMRLFIIEPFTIPTRSMVPTIVPDDSVYAEKISIKAADFNPTPGQVYTFINPEDPSETLIKRVIATEGQVVDLRDGYVYVDGVKLNEPYTHGQKSEAMRSTAGVTYPYTVPEDCFWAMGDNRGNSGDSRVFGAVPVDNITGHAVFRYWPIVRLGDPQTIDLGWFSFEARPLIVNLGPLDYTSAEDNPQKSLGSGDAS